MSVSRWRRALASSGREALASEGAGVARCRLSDRQLRQLKDTLNAGPVAHGWGEDCWGEDCWTLARIGAVIHRRFGVHYTLARVGLLLHRIGWSVQIPARRAAERDEARIAEWKDGQWPALRGRRRTWAPGSVSKTRPASG
nr:winged helix-turn-helix domain-containing protein [Streptomyces albofaciens]